MHDINFVATLGRAERTLDTRPATKATSGAARAKLGHGWSCVVSGLSILRCAHLFVCLTGPSFLL